MNTSLFRTITARTRTASSTRRASHRSTRFAATAALVVLGLGASGTVASATSMRTRPLVEPKSTAVAAPIPSQIPIVVKSKVRVPGTPFTVKIDTAVSSLCPPDVECVWAGNYSMSARVFGAGLPKAGKALALTYSPGNGFGPKNRVKIKGWWFGIVVNVNRDAMLRVQPTAFDSKKDE